MSRTRPRSSRNRDSAGDGLKRVPVAKAVSGNVPSGHWRRRSTLFRLCTNLTRSRSVDETAGLPISIPKAALLIAGAHAAIATVLGPSAGSNVDAELSLSGNTPPR
jgi:hypothetical protein